MGVLTDLRTKYTDHAKRVEDMVKYRKYANPGVVGDKKWFKVTKGISYTDAINAFSMEVDDIIPSTNDKGVTEYSILDKGLRFSLSKNMAAQFEGRTRIRLLGRNMEPDEDLRCTLYSIWEARADDLPEGNINKGKGRDYMINLSLIKLDEGMVNSLRDSKAEEKTEEKTEEKVPVEVDKEGGITEASDKSPM